MLGSARICSGAMYAGVPTVTPTVEMTSTGVIVQGGDSGSPVFTDESGGSVKLLGGLWGGNQSGTQFVYSPIDNIRAELGALLSTH